MALFKGRKQNAPDTAPPPDTGEDSAAADALAFDPDGTGSADQQPADKPRAPLLLIAGLAFLVVAVGVGSYFFFFAPAVEEIEVPDTPVSQQAQAPEEAPDDAAPGEELPLPDSDAPEGEIAEPAPQSTTTPAEVHEQSPPPPPAIRDFIAAQDGKGLQPNNAVPAVTLSPQPSAELYAQLQTLWKQGAAAKWRGDYAAARRVWSEILRLRPGHPGIQEAIDKLPQQ